MGWKDWSYALKTAIIYTLIWIILASSFFIYILNINSEMSIDFFGLIGFVTLFVISLFYIIPVWIVGLINGKIFERILDKDTFNARKGFLIGLVIGISLSFLTLGLFSLSYIVGFFHLDYGEACLYLFLPPISFSILGWIVGKIRNR